MRKRVRVTTAIPIGSSDYNNLKNKREILSATHEDRMAAINMMTFSVNPTSVHHGSVGSFPTNLQETTSHFSKDG